MYLEKLPKKDVGTKNLYVKRWWNWHQLHLFAVTKNVTKFGICMLFGKICYQIHLFGSIQCSPIIRLFSNVTTYHELRGLPVHQIVLFSKISMAWVDFTNMFTRSFCTHRSYKRKNSVKSQCLFVLLGSVYIKATRARLMKLTSWHMQRTKFVTSFSYLELDVTFLKVDLLSFASFTILIVT